MSAAGAVIWRKRLKVVRSYIIGYWAGDYFQALRHIIAPAAPTVRQQSSLLRRNESIVPSHISLENHNFSFSIGLSTRCNYRSVKF